ncbi:8-oxo-dGDP phosphatase NUDT18-like [Carassius gibelio]|uniref:8-oxo-dGDP phosphatase NUDT18-like n=1 Tax=Carassius gibelio TaxID=101364 RepID=UPI0022785C2E|nr:8-oxo-dGDP phosphatase NUDT18-like [Carassius gibelio]
MLIREHVVLGEITLASVLQVVCIYDGECIKEAPRREVKEEVEIDCKPITLLQIQEKVPSWIHFDFLAEKIVPFCVIIPCPPHRDAIIMQRICAKDHGRLKCPSVVKYCMPSIYEQLSVNTCVILEVQHNRRIPSQTDGVCLNTLVLLEYKEEEEEISLNIPPKPKNDGFRRPEGTKQNLRTEILKKIQEASVLPVEKKPMNENFSWNLY